MELFLINHDCKYAAEQVMLLFFPNERPVYPERPSGALSARISLSRTERRATAYCVLRAPDGRRFTGRASIASSLMTDGVSEQRYVQRIIKMCFYRAAVRFCGKRPPWGAVTGVRPCKLMSAAIAQTGDCGRAAREFMRVYDVSPERAKLCLDASLASVAAAKRLGERDVCLYVGIPFCPTRCAYCSFVSQTVERSMELIPPFLRALERDIAATASAVREARLRPVSLYFGGGTPTTLSAGQLNALFCSIERSFDLGGCGEIAVEAGRPDTIDAEKLAVLRAHGVTRLSVNPQSMDDAVLAAIGRRHTVEDVMRAYSLARNCGGFEINMDLIAGLPSDSVEGFCRSLDTVLGMEPENITVHTLSLKKGSRIMLESTALPDERSVERMLYYASNRLRGAGYSPYYLYRQKYMSGGFENVGWCLEGHENLYNICIMEELCGIISLGGGASTKLGVGDGRLERHFAPKYPREYIENIDRICEGKERIKEFYNGISAK